MDNFFSESVCAIALNRIFGFEPQIANSLIDNLGSAAAVFRLDREERTSLFGPFNKYTDKITTAELESAQREWEKLTRDGVQFVLRTDAAYPALLRECPDAPVMLYVRSDTAAEDIFNRGNFISVVGTRDISPYGKEWCERIVCAMAEAPEAPCIVSGMAFGVDICAHMAALASKIPTIGVLPVGIDTVYPWRHRVAAEKIVATPGGALVTDYPPGTAPVAVNFLRRNRIIAGLSSATVLVESKLKGGGTMTARLASSYGREVFCLQGRIDDVRSEGCNLLIREKIAEPVPPLPELTRALGLGEWNRRKRSTLEEELRKRYGGRPDCEALLATAVLIKGNGGIRPDEICRRLGITFGNACALTGTLESDGFIDVDLLQGCCINFKRS